MARSSYWDDSLINLNPVSGGQANALLSATPGGISEGFTVVRCIVTLYAAHFSTPLNDGGQYLDLGVGLVTKEAEAARVFPDPNTNTEALIGDWMWRSRVLVLQDAATMLRPMRIGGDFRSGRKLASGVLVLVVNNTPTIGTAFTVKVGGAVRMLILRP